jgi:multidrug efflux pump subunit AcrA (membrane-fusion protein)
VWVVRDGRIEKRAVELGSESAGSFPVLKGLDGGESVVIDPPRRLRDGAAVELEGA